MIISTTTRVSHKLLLTCTFVLNMLYDTVEKSRSLMRIFQIRKHLEKISVHGSRRTGRCRNELMVSKVSKYSGPGLVERNWQYLENSWNGSHFEIFHFSRFGDHVFRMEIEGRGWYQMKGYPRLPISYNWKIFYNFSGLKVMAILKIGNLPNLLITGVMIKMEGREWYQSTGRPWFPISCPLKHFVYLSPFLSYRHFYVRKRSTTWVGQSHIAMQ